MEMGLELLIGMINNELEKLASRGKPYEQDEFDPMELFDSMDEAYWSGFEDGKTELSGYLLKYHIRGIDCYNAVARRYPGSKVIIMPGKHFSYIIHDVDGSVLYVESLADGSGIAYAYTVITSGDANKIK